MPEPEFSHTGMYSGASVQTLLRKRAGTTGTQAERVLTDHLPCPHLVGNGGGARDERLVLTPSLAPRPMPPADAITSTPIVIVFGELQRWQQRAVWGLEGQEGSSPSSTTER